jgi:hypothetical protein
MEILFYRSNVSADACGELIDDSTKNGLMIFAVPMD